MEYTTLGHTKIEISKICVGCMSFGKAGTMHDWTLNAEETENVVKHALDLGINFFDTANGYSAGTSEEYLGCALKKNVQRKNVVIASKVYFNPGRLSKEAIHREIDGTLQRLGTDYLDLYIIHRFDYETPIEETMEALNDLVKTGKVRALGASAMYGYQFYNMQLAAREHGWAQFQAMENHYNFVNKWGVSLMPYSPLAAGHLTRPTWLVCRYPSQQNRLSCYGKIRPYRIARYANCQPSCSISKAIWSKHAANCTCLALGKRCSISNCRRNQVLLSG